MDNELDALERSKQMVTPDCFEMCENCGHWRPFNTTTGFCLDDNNWHDETLYDSWCDQWKEGTNHEHS